VIYCNPPGSQSYGESFARAVTGRWGEADFPALMAFVDAAVAAGVADPARLGITGRSYGGFSTLWVITHSERFRAAVAAEPISHLESFYGSSDIGWDWGSLQFGTDPWNGPETYRRLSPTTYAERVTTPLRLIACLSDNRTPHEQAEQMFVRLRKLGRTVDMVLIAGESHAVVVVGRPWSRVHHMRATLEFFLRHLPT
jgi:dipeptidyl aminopeptidase/acylaminoacyl peptidase